MTAAVILAGGRGLRMGGNKPFYPWQGMTLIKAVIGRLVSQVDTLLINAGSHDGIYAELISGLGYPVLFDKNETCDRGPLSGVLTSLQWAQGHGLRDIVTAPCDMPSLPVDMVETMCLPDDVDVVFFSGLRDYPLCARWNTALAQNLAKKLAETATGLPVMRFLDDCKSQRLPVYNEAAFANINSPDHGIGNDWS